MERGSIHAQLARVPAFLLKLPVHAYRWTLKPFIGQQCRHLPTCSQYALDAITLNGAWRGGWLTLSRLWRCRPGGTSGYDPPPDLRETHHTLQPWRYGLWTRMHDDDDAAQTGVDGPSQQR